MQLCTGEPLCDFPRHFAQIQAFSLSVEFHLVRIISLLVAKLLESENDNDERKQIGMTCGRNTKLGADDVMALKCTLRFPNMASLAFLPLADEYRANTLVFSCTMVRRDNIYNGGIC